MKDWQAAARMWSRRASEFPSATPKKKTADEDYEDFTGKGEDIVREITIHERALVGMVLIDPSALDRSEIELGGFVWTDPVCSILWPLICRLRSQGEPIADIRIVAEHVGTSLDAFGGRSAFGPLLRDAGMAGKMRTI